MCSEAAGTDSLKHFAWHWSNKGGGWQVDHNHIDKVKVKCKRQTHCRGLQETSLLSQFIYATSAFTQQPEPVKNMFSLNVSIVKQEQQG